MTDEHTDVDQHAVNRFWHNYLPNFDKNTVPMRSRAWYRKYVEMYIAAHGYERLTAHTLQIVGDYLIAKGRNLESEGMTVQIVLGKWQFVCRSTRRLTDHLSGKVSMTPYS